MKSNFTLLSFVAVYSILNGCASTTTINGIKDPEPSLKSLWTLSDPSIQNPESAYYDTDSNTLFISNVAGEGTGKDKNGWISKVDATNGKIIVGKWVTGFNAPKGMRVHQGILWVSDIDQLVSINIKSGKISKRIKIPGAKFLNDVAIGPEGEVYVSDMMTGLIHAVKNGKTSTFVKDPEGELPNGLLVKNNALLVTSWGIGMNPDFSTVKAGNLSSFDLKTKRKTLVSNKSFGNLDGLEADGNGGYLVTDWYAGKLYSVDSRGEVRLIFSDKQGTADIGYIPATKTLIVPQMVQSQVQAYTVQ